MSSLRCVNFFDLCRVCTVSSEDKTNVFSAEGKRKNLTSKLAECLSLNVDEKDRLPKVVCGQCLQNVETILEFRKICKNSQTMLANCLNTATLQNGGKVYIKDAIGGSGKSLSVLGNAISSGAQVTSVNHLPNANVQSIQTNMQGNDFINSLIQAVGAQNSSAESTEKPLLQHYTITLDNNRIKTEPSSTQSASTSHTITPTQQKSEKDAKQLALEEFLKMKPNIKVTPLGKKDVKKNQLQQHNPHTETAPSLETQEQTAIQQSESQQLQQQQQIAQLQIQQLQQQIQQQIQQQWQQQQLQQQIQQLTSQLQPQPQITITAPTLTTNDPLSPSKNKKPKLNFVLTSPTSQTLSASIPQIATQAPQIQLQLHPSVPLQTPQQQQAAAAALLSNLAPLLQQQAQQSQQAHIQSNQTQTSTEQLLQTAVGQAANINTTSLLSPNKCFLPITIKHENSDQQIVAHIDTKNLVLPTTYQLQMKLQPQISMVDGQPIMQLTPTTIPATIQLTPQTLGNQTFQTNPLNSSNTLQQQLFQHQQNLQNTPQILSQQIIRTPQTPPSNTALINTNDVATSTNDQCDEFVINDTKITKPADQQQQPHQQKQQQPLQSQSSQESQEPLQHQTISIARKKYKITQQPGSNTIEITPTSNFTQQIMQQVQQQQKQKQQQQQQQQGSATSATSNQQAGITVQRLSNVQNTTLKQGVTMKKIENQKSNNSTPSTSTTTTSQITKMPILNKQNITISRVMPQQQPAQITQQQFYHQPLPTEQHHHQQHQQQQEDSKPIIIADEKLQALPATPAKPTTQQCEQIQQQQQHTQITLQQHQHPQLEQQDVKLNKKLTPQQSKLLAEAKKHEASIKIEEEQIAEMLNDDVSGTETVGSTQNTNTSTTTSASTNNLPNRGVGIGNFECTHCGRAFKKKEHLTQHVKLHAGLRPFKCTEDGCDKAFSRKEHLLRHLVSHTGKKMFSCDVCQKPFSRKDNLNKHRRIHSGQPNANNYVCEVCNKAFAVKAYYEQHKASHIKAEGVDIAKSGTTKSAQSDQHNEFVKNDQHQQQEQQHNQHQHQQQLQNQPQQIHILQQTIPHANGQHAQPHQIMHLQLPTVVTTQDLAGNTITITQSHDPNTSNLKTMGSQDATLLNLPSSLANFVQLGQAQFVNAQTGQIMGHIKIEK